MSDFKPDIESARFEITRLEREIQQLKSRIAELERERDELKLERGWLLRIARTTTQKE